MNHILPVICILIVVTIILGTFTALTDTKNEFSIHQHYGFSFLILTTITFMIGVVYFSILFLEFSYN